MKRIDKITIILTVSIVLFTGVLFFGAVSSDLGGSTGEVSYSSYFDPEKITTVNLTISDEDWQDMMENPLAEEYHLCNVEINGDAYEAAAIRTKGMSSLSQVASSDSDRYSFKIKSDEYVKDQTFNGLSKFVLNNNYRDATYMKEYLSYQMMTELGVPTPLFSYAAVYINGEYYGLYLMVEAVEEEFAERNFGADFGNLYKPMSMGGKGANLVYTDDLLSSYPGIFNNTIFSRIDTPASKVRVVTALKHLKEGSDLDKYIDTDEVLRYFAVNTALVNLDSYAALLIHNYYLYEKDGKLSMIPWDYNQAFGTGFYMLPEDILNFPIDTPLSPSLMLSDRPMIGSLLADETYKERYHSYLTWAAEEFFGSTFAQRVDSIDNLINEYVMADPTIFYSYDEYLRGVSQLKKFVGIRADSILGQLNGTIPSTREAQKADRSSLLTADGLSFSALGLTN